MPAHGVAAAEVDHAQLHAGIGQVGEQHRHAADRRFVAAGRGLLAADVERQAIRVEAQLAGADHQLARRLDRGAELAGQRPLGAVVLHQQAAVDAGARGVLGQLLQLLGAVEGEHAHPGGVGAPDGGHLFDRVAIADGGGGRTSVQAELDLLERGGVEAAAEADKALQDRRSWVGLHGIVDARQRQRAEQRAVVLLDAVHVEHEARGGGRTVSEVRCDLGGHRA